MQSTSINAPVNSRYLWADFIRSVGILLVILGHVSAVVVNRMQLFSRDEWLSGNIYNVIARSCVPILFMVSGALLLPKQESLRDFYSKRVKKVILPFIVWSILYLAVINQVFSGGIIGGLKTSLLSIVMHPAAYHLWFMYELLGIYMLTPIFRIFVNNASRGLVWYFIGIWFLFGAVQRQVEGFFSADLIFELGYLTGYIGYFVLGYLLTNIKLTPRLVWTAAITYLFCAAFTVFVTYRVSTHAGIVFDYYQNLLGWNIVLLSVSAYILLRAAALKIFSRPRPQLEKIVLNISAASFGIYLIHVFAMGFLNQFSALPLSGPPTLILPVELLLINAPVFVMIPLATLATFALSWALISIVQRIPYLRALVA